MVMELRQFDYKDCVADNLLRRIPPSKEKAEASIRAANNWLEEAEKGLKNDAFNSSVLASYLVMFHSARAILFFDGFREKSHYCVARYLEEKYVKTSKLEKQWVELLDHFRGLRHDSQYDVSFITSKDEAEEAFGTAERFLERLRKLLEQIEKQ